MKKTLKKKVSVEMKVHIWYIVCGNWKYYDIFSIWDKFWFYSKSNVKTLSWEFIIDKTIDDITKIISRSNDWYSIFYFE